jgi:hypothetical protein
MGRVTTILASYGLTVGQTRGTVSRVALEQDKVLVLLDCLGVVVRLRMLCRQAR